MKKLDYIYAHIYIWYNRMKLNGRKVDPQSLTAAAFTIWSIGLCIAAIQLYDLIFDHRSKINTLAIAIIGPLCGGIVNEIYSRDFRYLEVYNEFVLNGTVINKRGILYAWIFILVPYLFFIPLLIWSK